MLARLVDALDRLVAMATPRCSRCGTTMAEVPQAPGGPSPLYEILYECAACGQRLSRGVAWEITD